MQALGEVVCGRRHIQPHLYDEMANAILIPQFDPDLSGFALKEHVHSQYLTEHQSLTNYATKVFVQNEISAIDFPDAGVVTFNGRAGAVEPKSGDYTSDMVGAAPKTHSHTGYASSTHNHDSDYAAKTHSHTGYASSTHNHDSSYAAKSHSHGASDITGLSGGVQVGTSTGGQTITFSQPVKAMAVWGYVRSYRDDVFQHYSGAQPMFMYPPGSSWGLNLSSNGKTLVNNNGSTTYFYAAFF